MHSLVGISTRRKPTMVGFSLVELLVTIVIIGVITAIAGAAVIKIKGEAAENAARRTAQIVASTAVSAQTAGDTTIAAAGTKEDAIELICAGVHGDGMFSHIVYSVKLSPKEKAKVANYLEFGGGFLVFNAAGGA